MSKKTKEHFEQIRSVLDGLNSWVLLNADAYEILADLRYRLASGDIDRLFDHTITDPGYDVCSSRCYQWPI